MDYKLESSKDRAKRLKEVMKNPPLEVRERMRKAIEDLNRNMPIAHSAEVLCTRMTW